MPRGNNTPQRGGRGTTRGGGSRGGTPRGSGANTPRGRGRGRGGGGGGRWEVEQEAQAVMATLGIPYHSPYGPPSPFRGGPNRGGYRGNQTPPRGSFSPRAYPPSNPNPNYYCGGGGRGGRGRGYQQFVPSPAPGRARRGGGLGYRQMPDDLGPGYEWARPIASGGRSLGSSGQVARARDPRDRPLLKPITFVRAGTLFEQEDELLKAEFKDLGEQNDEEQVAEWLARAFEKAREIELEKEGMEELQELEREGRMDFLDVGEAVGSASAGGSGVATPGDELEELVAQAVMPGVYFQAQSATKASTATQVNLPVEQPEAMRVDTDDEEEKIVYVAPVQRSQAVSKAPSLEPLVKQAEAPRPVAASATEEVRMVVDVHLAPSPAPAIPALLSPPTHTTLYAPFYTPPTIPAAPHTHAPPLNLPPYLTLSQPHSLLPSLDPSRPGTPSLFPTPLALSTLLGRFSGTPGMGEVGEGTTSVAETPGELAHPHEHGVEEREKEGGVRAEDVVRALQSNVSAAAEPEREQRTADSTVQREESVPPAFPSVPDSGPGPAEQAESAPTFPTFAFSPSFASPQKPSPSQGKGKKPLKRKEIKRLRRAARRQRARLSMPGGEEAGGVPRMGDSDLEWGSEGPPVRVAGEESGSDDADEFSKAADRLVQEKELSDALGGMDIDDLDEDAMARFALGVGAGQKSIADLDVEEKVRREDGDRSTSESEDGSDGVSESDSEDLEEVLREAERELVGESDEDEESEDVDEEAGEGGEPVAGPSGGLKARLARANAKGAASSSKQGKWRLNYDEDDEDEDDEELFQGDFAWKDAGEDGEEELLEKIQKVLDENEGILKGKDRKSRKKLFEAIRDGNFEGVVDEDDELHNSSILKSKNRKRNDLPLELQIQWDKDRAKKADYKRARALERKQQMGNPFKASAKGKGKGKKGKSNPDESDTSETDSEFDPEYEEITDMFALERMIRVFLRDLGKTTMTLPAMDKESRRRVHLIADCFKLKSQSKGQGVARFPILTKTTRSGVAVDEAKVQRILGACKDAGPNSNMAAFNKAYFRQKNMPASGKGSARHVEGEIVGAKAAKIGETNVGYKMLQMMGWSEGAKIGLQEGGIVDPLTARIKRTKLGLGAAF